MSASPADPVAGAADPGCASIEPVRAAMDGGQDAPLQVAGIGVVRSWPLLVLAAPAAVAVWSGWVGLGQMTGFGIVHPLPGIWSSLRVDTAVTLPVGVEAYVSGPCGGPDGLRAGGIGPDRVARPGCAARTPSFALLPHRRVLGRQRILEGG
jgi:hypothetical protein